MLSPLFIPAFTELSAGLAVTAGNSGKIVVEKLQIHYKNVMHFPQPKWLVRCLI
jgi:hypothetical protein